MFTLCRYTAQLLCDSPAYTERSPNVPEWSHEVIFLGTKQERYRNVPGYF